MNQGADLPGVGDEELDVCAALIAWLQTHFVPARGMSRALSSMNAIDSKL